MPKIIKGDVFLMKKKENQILGELDYEEFHNFLDSRVFEIHNMLLVDKESYKLYFTKFYNYLKQGFEKEEVRTYPVRFKFTVSGTV